MDMLTQPILRAIATTCLVAIFLYTGYSVGYDKADKYWTDKYNTYLKEMSIKQQEVIDAKDKTILLIIDRYNTIKGISDRSSAIASRLQYQLGEANRKLRRSEATACKEQREQLSGCQELLSEGVELLREGASLATKLSVAQ